MTTNPSRKIIDWLIVDPEIEHWFCKIVFCVKKLLSEKGSNISLFLNFKHIFGKCLFYIMHFLFWIWSQYQCKNCSIVFTRHFKDFVQSQIILMCSSRTSVCQGNPGSYTSPDNNVYRNRMLFWRTRGLGLVVFYNITQ